MPGHRRTLRGFYGLVLILALVFTAHSEVYAAEVNSTVISVTCQAAVLRLGTTTCPDLSLLLAAEGQASCVGDVAALEKCALDPSQLSVAPSNNSETCPLCLPSNAGCIDVLSHVLSAVRVNASLDPCNNAADVASLVLLRDQGTVGCNAATATVLGDLNMDVLQQCGTCGVIPCVPGMFCPGNALPTVCPAGFFCASSTEKQVAWCSGS